MATITYDGKTISIESEKMVTLKCDEKVFKTDIVVTGVTVPIKFLYNKGSSPSKEDIAQSGTPLGVGETLTLKCRGFKGKTDIYFYSEPRVTIAGAWDLNVTLSTFKGNAYGAGDELVAATAQNGKKIVRIGMDIPMIDVEYLVLYFEDGTSERIYEFDMDEWLTTERQINFGNIPVTVSKSFYDWFTANAEMR